MMVPFGKHRRGVVGVDVVGHPVEVEMIDVADRLRGAIRQDRFEQHGFAAKVHMRLEVAEDGRFLQHVEALV